MTDEHGTPMTNKYETMQDWELEREVLTRLGWTVEPDDDGFKVTPPNALPRYWTGNEDISGLWQTFAKRVTMCVNDLNAAWSLPLPDDWLMFVLRNGSKGNVATIHQIEDDNLIFRAIHSTNPARAVCIVWLLFMDTQGAGTE